MRGVADRACRPRCAAPGAGGWSRAASASALPLPAAVAAYYRSQFLNTTLPGGVLGDVHRGVRHGRDAGDAGAALRAVAWERAAGQVVQVAAGRRRAAGAALAGARRPTCRAVAGRRSVVVGLAGRCRRWPVGTRRVLARRPAACCWRAGPGPASLLASALALVGHVADVPGRRPRRRGRRAPTGPAGAAGAARAAGDGGPGQRRRLGAARGRRGLGVRRRRARRRSRGRDRRRVRRDGARRRACPALVGAGRRAAAGADAAQPAVAPSLGRRCVRG